MLAIDTAAGGKLTMKFFGATTNSETGAKDPIVADLPDSNPEVGARLPACLPFLLDHPLAYLHSCMLTCACASPSRRCAPPP